MESFSITPSHIIEFLYCPRFTYYEYVLRIPQYEDKLYKVQKGRKIHERKISENADYLRKRIGVVRKHLQQYLTNGLLRGEIDEVLELADGTMAPLDYKFAEYKQKVYTTYCTQLYCYALLISENFQRQVSKGFLIYTRSQNKLVEVEIGEGDLNKVRLCAEKIKDIITNNRYPKATRFKRRCIDCTYRNICIK